MKRLALLFLLIPFLSYSQGIYQQNNLFGTQSNRALFLYDLGMPRDTFAVPTAYQDYPHVAGKDGIIYYWDWSGTPKKWVVWNSTGGGSSPTWGSITGLLSAQTDLQTALNAKVPTSRTLTFNGTAYDLSADRTFTFLTPADTMYIHNQLTNVTSLNFSQGLYKASNNVIALVNDALWNANKIQGRNVSTTAPTDGQVLTWNNALSRWEPGAGTGTGGAGVWGAITGTIDDQTDLFTTFYTKTDLQTSGGAIVHWDNITGAPTFLTSEVDPLSLKIASNLSDLANVGTARTNLGLGSLSTLNSINNSNWSGTALSVSNGGTGIGTLTGVVVGNGASAMSAVSGTASQLLRRNAANTGYEFFTPTYISSETDPLFTANGVPNTRTLTINGIAFDLSANRTWTIPTGITSETDPIWTAAIGNYYTKTNLQTSGQALVHWGNITNAPTFLTTETDPVSVHLTGNQTIQGTKVFDNNSGVSWGSSSIPLSNAGVLNTYFSGAGYYGNIEFHNSINSFIGSLTSSALTATRQYLLPDKSGTVAMTSDISGAGFITTETDPLSVHTTGTQTISGTKTFNSNIYMNTTSIMAAGGYYTTNLGSMSTPAGTDGQGVFYSKTDNLPYFKNSAGVEMPLYNNTSGFLTSVNLALGTATGTTQPITNSGGSGFTLPTFTLTTAGLVPAPTGASTGRVLIDNGTWASSAQSLQQVTNTGNLTTNPIIIDNSGGLESQHSGVTEAQLGWTWDGTNYGGFITLRDIDAPANQFPGTIVTENLTAGRNWIFPDKSGTIAMLSDIAGGGSMVYPSAGIPVSTGSAWGTSLTGTANQLLRRNAGNTAYEFFTPTYITTETDPVAGAVNGIIKSNGAGVFSAATAADFPNLSGSYIANQYVAKQTGAAWFDNLRIGNKPDTAVGFIVPQAVSINAPNQRNLRIGKLTNFTLGTGTREDDSTYFNSISAVDTLFEDNTNTSVMAAKYPKATLGVNRVQYLQPPNGSHIELGAAMDVKKTWLANSIDSVVADASTSDFVFASRVNNNILNMTPSHRAVINSRMPYPFDVNTAFLSTTSVGTTSGSSTHLRGWWGGITSYLIGSPTQDTIDNWVSYWASDALSVAGGIPKIKRYYNYAAFAGYNNADSLWFLYQRPIQSSPNMYSYIHGNLRLGGGSEVSNGGVLGYSTQDVNVWTNYKLEVDGTTYMRDGIYTSPTALTGVTGNSTDSAVFQNPSTMQLYKKPIVMAPTDLALGTATATTQPITNTNGTGFTLGTFGVNAGLVPGTTASGKFLTDGGWVTPSFSLDATVVHLAGAETITGVKTFRNTALVGTTSDAIIIDNTTASTSGVPVHVSPSLTLKGTAWNAGWAQSVNQSFTISTVPVSSLTAGATLAIRYDDSRSGSVINSLELNATSGLLTLRPYTNNNGAGLSFKDYNGTVQASILFNAGNNIVITGPTILATNNAYSSGGYSVVVRNTGTGRLETTTIATASNLALGTATATTQPITNDNGTGFTLSTFTATTAGLVPGTTATGKLLTDGGWVTPTYAQDANVMHLSGDEEATGTKTFGGVVVSGGATLNSIFTNNSLDGKSYITTNTASMTAPASGKGIYYSKTDGLPYFKNSAGTEMPLYNTGGSGSLPTVAENHFYIGDATSAPVDAGTALTFNPSNKHLTVNAGGTYLGGMYIDGTVYPVYGIQRNGTDYGFWTVSSGAGGFLSNSQDGDMIFRADQGRLLLGQGSGTSAVEIGTNYLALPNTPATYSTGGYDLIVRNQTTGKFEINNSAGGGSMVYPGAGIPVSTGSAWGSSIADNSGNWNTAYNKNTVSGSYSAGTLTLTKQDATTIPITGFPTNNNQLTNGSNYVSSTVSNTYTAGAKQLFQGNATTAGLGFGGVSSDPSALSNYDVWFNSTSALMKYRAGGVTRTVANTDEAQTLTNKTIDANSNTISNIERKVGVSITSPLATEQISLLRAPAGGATATGAFATFRGTGFSLTYAIHYGTTYGTSLGTVVASTTTAASGATTLTINTASIPANAYVWLVTTAASGVIDEFTIHLLYKY